MPVMVEFDRSKDKAAAFYPNKVTRKSVIGFVATAQVVSHVYTPQLHETVLAT